MESRRIEALRICRVWGETPELAGGEASYIATSLVWAGLLPPNDPEWVIRDENGNVARRLGRIFPSEISGAWQFENCAPNEWLDVYALGVLVPEDPMYDPTRCPKCGKNTSGTALDCCGMIYMITPRAGRVPGWEAK